MRLCTIKNMIKTFLESLEDPNRPLLAPNYWIMKKIGIILPKNVFGKVAYIFLHQFVTFFVISQFMELFVIKSNMELVITNLKISMLSSVCVIKSNTFVIWQSSWKEVLEYVTEADKFERDTQDPEKVKILKNYTKYCRIVTYFYWFLVFTTFITVTHTPLLRFLSSAAYREELKNGTELFPHIFSSWIPFDKYHSPGSWITVLLHAVMCAYGATIMGAYDASIIVIMVFFGGKLELLRIRSKKMFGVGGNGINDQEGYEVIRQLHEIHFTLTKYSKLFNSLLSPVMFFYVVVCSLMICFSAVQLTSANNATQTLVDAEYLVFGIAQLFMFCWHSNDVLYKSQNFVQGLYESEWWAVNIRQRKAAHILAGQFRINHVFKAGPFTDLTLSTFITILKGAYSYYTLLRK